MAELDSHTSHLEAATHDVLHVEPEMVTLLVRFGQLSQRH
jgi:hypothetical protein